MHSHAPKKIPRCALAYNASRCHTRRETRTTEHGVSIDSEQPAMFSAASCAPNMRERARTFPVSALATPPMGGRSE